MKRRSRVRFLGAAATAICAPATAGPAHADIGVPMIFATLPAMLVALVPIIVVEGVILGKRLGLRFAQIVWPSALANIVSTIVGMPITWGILFVFEAVTSGPGSRLPWTIQKILYATIWSAWLPPEGPSLYWIGPAATLSLMVPFFLASWLLESEVLWRTLLRAGSVPAPGLLPRVRAAALRANAASYAGLALFVLAWLVTSVLGHRPH